MKRRLSTVLCFLLAPAALGAPTVSGSPRWASDTEGCALAGEGSRYAVKAVTTGTAADTLGAMTIHDARTGAKVNSPLGTFQLLLRDPGARFGSGRTVAFHPWGWTETVTDGGLSATVEVVTLSHGVFGVAVSLTGLSTAATLRASVDGTLTAGSASLSSGAGQFPSVVTLDAGESRPFGLALGTSAGSSASTGSGGASYSTSLEVAITADGTTAFVLAFDDVPGDAAARGNAALAAAGAPEGWRAAAETRWAQALGSFSAPHGSDGALDAAAIAVLLNNEIRASDGALRGAVPAKTASNYFEVRDSALQSLGAAEESAARAIAYLDGVIRGQRSSGTHLGLIPHRVDEGGLSPSFGSPSASDDYSERPAFGPALRALRDVSTERPADSELSRLLDAQFASLTWWRTHRDWDQDLVLEANGGLESGSDSSPRFNELWGAGEGARLPVPELTPPVRTPLDAADVSSSIYAEYVEASQLAAELAREEDGQQSLSRASLLGAQIDEATFGFWDDVRGAYFDYHLTGTERVRTLSQVRTPVMWAPVVVGAARDRVRSNRALEHLLSASEFWRPSGIPSVAIAENTYEPARWRGAAFAETQYDAMVALYRYGYEQEAEELRGKLLAALAAGRFQESWDAETGAAQGPGCFGTTAALAIAAARNRHHAESFALERGGIPRTRTGELRRLVRLHDGQLLLGVRVEGSGEVPVTRATSATQIFGDAPMTLEFSDPHGVVGAAAIQVELPIYEHVVATWADGRSETLTGEGVSLTAHVGDRIELEELRFSGNRSCGCGSPGTPLALAVLLGLGAWRRRRAQA